jgi:membrane protease YdiL (CAAX protease family)
LGGDTGEGQPLAAPATDREWAQCWRCAKTIRRAERQCPHCRAPRRRLSDAEAGARRLPDATAPMAKVMVFFGLFLLTSLVFGVLTSFGLQDETPSLATAMRQLHLMLGVEIVDAALVGVALLVVGRRRRWPPLTRIPQVVLWVAAVIGVFALVAVNGAYHDALRRYLSMEPTHDAIVAATGLTPLVVIAYCLQPAIVEELFFRYLLLDTLRGVMNVHQAVIISSLMFGMAHIGVPLSVPMLILVGIPLGYARVMSGSLALPMLIHFLHNGIITVLE